MKKTFCSLVAIAAAFMMQTSAHGDVLVYEGFEYTANAPLAGLNGGVGWGAAWSTADATTANNFHSIGDGLSFGSLVVGGGSAERAVRNGRSTAERTISASGLTADNTTVYFSVLMDPTINTGATGGQFSNTYGTLIFGNEGLTDASIGTQEGEGTDIANSGNGVGVGFFGGPTSFADGGIQGVTFSGGVIDQSDGASNSIVTGDALSLIVGKIDWAANGSLDTISLYNIVDPATGLPATAFSIMTLDVDQSDFDTISIADGQTSAFDEIRFGATVADVLPVPEPTSLGISGVIGTVLLGRRRRR